MGKGAARGMVEGGEEKESAAGTERHGRERKDRKRFHAGEKALKQSQSVSQSLCQQARLVPPGRERPPQTVGWPLPVGALTPVPGQEMSMGRDLEFVNFLFLLCSLLKK